MPKHTKVIDIEETIIGWAKEVFKITRSKEQARIKDDDLAYTVNWSRARIVHSEPEYSDKKQPVAPNSQVLFKTTFTNNTDHQQEYSFKTERTTSSTCDVCIEKGVSYGAELGLTLKLPEDVLEVGTGFKKELSVNKTVGETFSEELTWGVDSLVKVPAKTITTARISGIDGSAIPHAPAKYFPKASAPIAMGAANPTVTEIQPARKPSDGW